MCVQIHSVQSLIQNERKIIIDKIIDNKKPKQIEQRNQLNLMLDNFFQS